MGFAPTGDRRLSRRTRMAGMKKYEYMFVRLGEGWFGAKREATEEYQAAIHEYANKGWRLVQVFAPSMGVDGLAKFYELILERELPG